MSLTRRDFLKASAAASATATHPEKRLSGQKLVSLTNSAGEPQPLLLNAVKVGAGAEIQRIAGNGR